MQPARTLKIFRAFKNNIEKANTHNTKNIQDNDI
jgi:hypothetical protein